MYSPPVIVCQGSFSGPWMIFEQYSSVRVSPVETWSMLVVGLEALEGAQIVGFGLSKSPASVAGLGPSEGLPFRPQFFFPSWVRFDLHISDESLCDMFATGAADLSAI